MPNELTEQPNDAARNLLEKMLGEKPDLSDVIAAGTAFAMQGGRKGVFALSHLIQATISGNAKEHFRKEYERYRDEGRIDEDYGQTTQAWECFDEALRAIDNDHPDETRTKAIRDVFLGIAQEQVTDRDDPLGYYLMKAATSLASMEVIVMRAAWRTQKVAHIEA